ncbi:hypothetical protein [Shouchella patagoniensis]|uniref:hypothetical protein n=1 Tax=Shouchella patagoniensis TaxID=228576 RepID=UPI000994D911|nr:hypothetical protein [Shouchella patagoniensis]
MKYSYVLIPLLLVVTGCTGEDKNQENANTSNSIESSAEQGSDTSITLGYTYDWENVERDLFSLDSQLKEEDYSNIETFFKTFELPDEGRLMPEEAKEYFSQNGEVDTSHNFSDGEIYYKNYLIFDDATNMATSTNIWGYDPNTYDPIEPFETQSVGLFMAIVNDVDGKGFVSPNGEFVDFYPEELTEEEHKYLQDDSLYTVDQEGNATPKGWGALQSMIDQIQIQLEYIEPYLKDYNELHMWSAETRQYLQVADSISYHDYEEAYKYIVAATMNIKRIEEVLPKK